MIFYGHDVRRASRVGLEHRLGGGFRLWTALLGVLLTVLSSTVAKPVLAATACGGPRAALVIGNKTYPDTETPLKGPVEGAKRIADALRAVGFDVQLGEDLTKTKMDAAVRDLEAKLKPGAAVFLYFSGFGVQAGGHTYLLPIDASIWSEADIAINGLNLDRLLSEIEDKKAAVEVVVIDAARRNPFERRFRATGSAGLAAPRSVSGNLVALYSARPDKVFDAGDFSAETFADDVAREISAPHATAQEAFKQVRAMVARTSRAALTPWGFTTLADDLPLDVHDCSGLVAQAAPAAPPADRAPPDKAPSQDKAPSPETTPPAADRTPPAVDKAPPAPAANAAPTPPHDDHAEAKPPVAPPAPAKPQDDQAAVLTDETQLGEIRDRLFEQNLDPGSVGSDKMAVAIRTYEQQAGLSQSGTPTRKLLDTLRGAKSLAPWGAITVADDVKSWGMSWDKKSRAEALSDAKTRCGSSCSREMAFYGRGCGAFTLSPKHWIVAHRDGSDAARKAALNDCSRPGAVCRVIGAVCADGSDKTD